MTGHWAVTVSRNGEELVTIESNCLSGKPEFSAEDERVIREAAAHLKAFIGEPKAEVCQCPCYEVVSGPYPSGFCRECVRWYPPKARTDGRSGRDCER